MDYISNDQFHNEEIRLEILENEAFKDIVNRKILAIYVTGSVLNGLQNKDMKDIDVFVVVADVKKDVVLSKTYNRQIILDKNKTEFLDCGIDVKVKDTREFYKMVLKSSFNTFDNILVDPMIINESDLVSFIKQHKYGVATMNIPHLIDTTIGFGNSLERSKDVKRSSLFFKTVIEIMDIISGQKIKYDFSDNDFIKKLKNKECTFDEIKEDLDKSIDFLKNHKKLFKKSEIIDKNLLSSEIDTLKGVLE